MEGASGSNEIWEDYLAWKAEIRARGDAENRKLAAELNRARFDRISEETFGRAHVVVFIVDACGAVPEFSERLAAVAAEYGIEDLFVTADRSWDEDDRLMRRVAFNDRLGTPSMVVLSYGRAVDAIQGGHDRSTLLQFLGRNGLIRDAPQYAKDYVSPPALAKAQSGRFHDGANFERLPLQNVWFQGGSVSGSNLRGADLRGADLRSTILARSDFTGADLRGALTEGAVWIGAICPDGTPADEVEGRTCEGHLGRAASR